MTVTVLIVDDEPDIETMFRQHFRREVRQGLYSLDFALSGKEPWINSKAASAKISFCWCPTSTCPA